MPGKQFGYDKYLMFKIQHKRTGLYSTGGMTPRFTRMGKVWRKGPLVLHLKLYVETWQHSQAMLDEMRDWQIVPVEYVEQEPREITTVISSDSLIAKQPSTLTTLIKSRFITP